ncbi:SYS1 (predicted) [Pycnogonum litorale]
MAGQFRYYVWDPLLISSQIVTMQFIYYFGLGMWLFVMNVLTGSQHSIGQIFRYEEINAKDIQGRCVMGAFVINSLSCALGLWHFVCRTKLCLDFTTTIHLWHFIICLVYNGCFASNLPWWLMHISCIIIMCVCGEFLCMRTEMKSIPINLGSKTDL